MSLARTTPDAVAICVHVNLAALMSVPKLSVLLPNYNHARYLPQAIEGILGQSLGDLELLIHDDASTDGSREVIAGYAAKDKRIRPFYSKTNIGVHKGVEKMLALANGEYLSGTAADDFFSDKSAYEDFSRLLGMYPSAGLAYGKSIEIHGDANDQDLWPLGHAHRQGLIAGAEFAEAFLKGLLFPNMFACLWRRSAYQRTGGISGAMGSLSDLWCMVTAGIDDGVIYVDKVYARQRLMKGRYTDSESSLKIIGHYAEIERRLIEAFPSFTIPTDWRAAYRARIIAYKLRPEWQGSFLESTREQFNTLDYWKEFYLPPAYAALKKSVLAECERLARELEAQKLEGERIFRETAGSL